MSLYINDLRGLLIYAWYKISADTGSYRPIWTGINPYRSDILVRYRSRYHRPKYPQNIGPSRPIFWKYRFNRYIGRYIGQSRSKYRLRWNNGKKILKFSLFSSFFPHILPLPSSPWSNPSSLAHSLAYFQYYFLKNSFYFGKKINILPYFNYYVFFNNPYRIDDDDDDIELGRHSTWN